MGLTELKFNYSFDGMQEHNFFLVQCNGTRVTKALGTKLF